jgi:hypothetical protein
LKKKRKVILERKKMKKGKVGKKMKKYKKKVKKKKGMHCTVDYNILLL